MRILIFSDVHGNLPAFEKMLTEEKDCDGYVCLGDLVNYGPWSNECVELAVSLPNSILIIGNHEEAFLKGVYPGDNSLVQNFFKTTFSKFNRLKQLKTFLKEYKMNNFICKHTINESYIYPDTKIVLDNNYIIGHSHHQFIYKCKNHVLYNVGSVGQNRKNIDKIDYVIYNSDLKAIEMKSIFYNIDIVIKEMKLLKYPEDCINYYLSKKTRI